MIQETDPDLQMQEATWFGLKSRGCSNGDGCPAIIEPGEIYLRDKLRGVAYCVPCGQRLRYHRKKAHQRQETIPATMADVRARHEAAGV